jgi:hypothetical protein
LVKQNSIMGSTTGPAMMDVLLSCFAIKCEAP